MENTCLMYALSFSLFCHASENVTNKPKEHVKSMMDEYNDSFKPHLETENKTQGGLAKDVANKNQQERRFGRGSSGPGEGEMDLNMDFDLRLKMNLYERSLRLEKYKRATLIENINFKMQMLDRIDRDIKQAEEELKELSKAKL